MCCAVLHSHIPEKEEELAQNNKKEHVVKALEGMVFKAEARSTDALNTRHPRVEYDVVEKARPESARLHEVACQFVDSVNADFLCIGSGHCNRKESLGSVAYNTLKHLQNTSSFPAMFIIRSQFR